MKAVILAAGEGKRLRPITSSRPKPMIKISGKPILEHIIEALSYSEVTEVIIVTNYKGESIQEYFKGIKKSNFKISFKKQEKMIGTGNALSITESMINDDFIVVYGDQLFSPNALKKIIQTFKTKKVDGAMAVIPIKNPENYGIIEVDKEQKVKRIIEKPDLKSAPSNLANAGLYVFSKEIFRQIKQVKTSIRGEYELTDAISLFIKDGKQIEAVKISNDDWLDIGRPWDLLEANKWILERVKHEVWGIIEEGARLIGPITIAKNARIRSGSYIEGPSFIDEGSDIGPNCYIRPHTSIGKNVRIGNACEIKNSIVMDKTHVGHLSYIGDSILCESCNLGAGTIIANYRFDAKSVKMKVQNKIINSGRRKLGAILGDNVKTGIHSILMPGVKVGKNSLIGVNYIVERDIPANTYAVQKQSVKKNNKLSTGS